MIQLRTAFLLGLVVQQALLAGEDPAVDIETVSIDEFRSMDFEHQTATLRAAFERRLEHGRNISYESTMRLRNHERDGESIGEVVWEGFRYDHRHWKLGDSYRMDTDQYGPTFPKDPLQFVQSGFDSGEGVGRMRVQGNGSEKIYGRIDTRHDRIIVDNRYSYWLDGEDVTAADFLIPYLVKHSDKYTIGFAKEEPLIELTVPWMPFHSRDKALGVRHFWLDPTKGFLPVKGEARWDDGPESWRTERFTVEASRLVGDVWMPTNLKEFIGSSSSMVGGRAGVINVWETTILKIEHGKVTAKDLIVDFPAGTEVVDAIEGVTYILGKDGNPVGKRESLMVGATRTRPELSENDKKGWPWLIVLNIVLLAVAALYYFIRRKKAAG